jgi:hypothetical protein
MTETQPSQRILDDIISRSVKFLSAVGTNATILSLMRANGFQKADHDEGWSLIHTASGYAPKKEAPKSDTQQTREIEDAEAQLDNWDEPHFRVIQNALARKFSATRDYLFRDGLSAKQGPEATISVRTFLNRIDDIINNNDKERREDAHKQDLEAIALLAQRGYHEAERKRLRGLIQIATSSADVPLPVNDTISQEEKQKTLIELYGWYKDWSTVAHVTIKRRDYLISMGLAERKTKKIEPPK